MEKSKKRVMSDGFLSKILDLYIPLIKLSIRAVEAQSALHRAMQSIGKLPRSRSLVHISNYLRLLGLAGIGGKPGSPGPGGSQTSQAASERAAAGWTQTEWEHLWPLVPSVCGKSVREGVRLLIDLEFSYGLPSSAMVYLGHGANWAIRIVPSIQL